MLAAGLLCPLCFAADAGGEAVGEEAELLPSGACGDGVTYTFDSETGMLSISYEGKGSGKIAYKAFGMNDVVKTIVIGDGVTEIGEYAFNRFSALTKIVIGKDVTKIGTHPFNICDNILTVVCYAEQPPKCADNRFFIISKNKVQVCVPDESIALYQKSIYWQNYNLHGISELEKGVKGTPWIDLTILVICICALTEYFARRRKKHDEARAAGTQAQKAQPAKGEKTAAAGKVKTAKADAPTPAEPEPEAAPAPPETGEVQENKETVQTAE